MRNQHYMAATLKNDPTSIAMEQDNSRSSDRNFNSRSIRTHSHHRSNSLLPVNSTHSSLNRYQSFPSKSNYFGGPPRYGRGGVNGGGGVPDHMFCKGGHPSSGVVELDGHQKFTLKKGYFENLRCPSCVMSQHAQIFKFQGVPWIGNYKKNYRSGYGDFYEGLSAELEDFFRFIRPTTEDEILRKATFYSISKSIKRCKRFPIEAVKYYGSYSSSTYLPVSDIDIVVFTKKEPMGHPQVHQVAVLFDVAFLLFQDGIIEKHCNIIPHSRIPLLKFYDCMTGFQINITVNTSSVMDRADYIRSKFCKNSEMLKILYFMKYYLLYKGTNQVYLGGIGSYALSLMVIRYFQEPSTKEMIKAGKGNSSLLARLLIGFLQRYSDLDFVRSHTISVRGDGAFMATPPLSNDHYPSYYFNKKTSILRIEDHMEPWRNVSSGSFNSDLILQDFGVLLNTLLNSNSLPTQGHPDKNRSIIGQGLYVVDSFCEYRAILSDIYGYWFSAFVYKPLANDKFDAFIAQRNIFGKRRIEFEYKRFDDNTAQLVLKDNFEAGVQLQNNRHYNSFCGRFVPGPEPVGANNNNFNPYLNYSNSYNPPPPNYHHFNGGPREDRPMVRQHYPNETNEFASSMRPASSTTPPNRKQPGNGSFESKVNRGNKPPKNVGGGGGGSVADSIELPDRAKPKARKTKKKLEQAILSDGDSMAPRGTTSIPAPSAGSSSAKEMDAGSKTLELKKMLNIDSKP